MRFREVFRYEFGYRLRGPSTWIYAAFLFFITAWGLAATADGGDVVKANAPKEVAQGIALFGGLFGMLVSAGAVRRCGDPRRGGSHGTAALHHAASQG